MYVAIIRSRRVKADAALDRIGTFSAFGASRRPSTGEQYLKNPRRASPCTTCSTSPGVKVFIPLATMVILSLVLSMVAWIVRR
jgi:hypothetical protein